MNGPISVHEASVLACRAEAKALNNRDLVNAYAAIQYDIGRDVRPFDDPRAGVLWAELMRRLNGINKGVDRCQKG